MCLRCFVKALITTPWMYVQVGMCDAGPEAPWLARVSEPSFGAQGV